LTEQPNAILEKLRDGSYVVDYASQRLPLPMQPSSFIGVPNPNHTKDRKSQGVPSVRISRDLKKLLADPSFVKSIPITTSTTIPPSQPTSSAALRAETDVPASITGSNQLLHLILLEASPDFIHVVSLKGNFLYVAPSVRRVLGYEPEEMVGGSISDYAHPEDVVPLMRELKEGSATGLAAVSATSSSGDSGEGGGNTAATDQSSSSHAVAMAGNMQMAPRTVDLLFRARTKAGPYVWIECKGRLHVEPGKGRKAIVLSGRAKEMPKLEWHHIARGGGLGLPVPMIDEDGTRRMVETEMWGTMTSGQSCGGVVSFLVVGHGVSDVLGWTPSELVGREVINYIVDGVHQFSEEVRILRSGESNPRRFFCKMRHKNGSSVDVVFVLYRSTNDSSATESIQGIIPAPLIYQIRTLQSSAASSATSFVHSLNSDVFEELDTSRDSSWQYEIQQIRFANKRLEDEIATLEKQLEDAEGVQQKVLDELQGDHQYSTTNNSSSSPLHSSSSPSVLLYPFMERQQHHPPDIQSPTSHYPTSTSLFSTQSTAAPLSGYSRDWDSVFVQQQQQSRLHQQRLKRSWDDHR
jgi:PAS domain-containing protein